MNRDSDLARFWASTYGLISDKYKTLYLIDNVDLHGFSNLHKRIESYIVENNADLLFVDMSSTLMDPFVLIDLKTKYKFTVIALAIDDEMKFTQISSTLSTIADLLITSDYISVDRYRQSGVNAHFLPLPVYIPNELPVENEKFKNQVSFIGRKAKDKPLRDIYLDVLEKQKAIDIAILGNQGSQTENFLSSVDMYSLFRNSAINLNFTGITVDHISENALFKRIRGMKLRPFEIYAAGGVCLSEYSISLAQCFKDGEDIIFFRNPQEMLSKIKYFLTHNEKAREIAHAGRVKVLETYSDKQTAKNLKILLQRSEEYRGLDLFGMPQDLEISRRYAIRLIYQIIVRAIEFLYKGKLPTVWGDLCFLIKFLTNLKRKIGLKATVQAVCIGFYMSLKTHLSKAKNWKPKKFKIKGVL
ncbi:glycosyltransferase [Paracoccaceae bacterium]|nr:glycosyltransferase [Paracoccaceae bacterium]